MTFQIRAIHLYSQSGERRTLPFTLNAVNIVTGRSATGKSSIIDIIDYCLGSSGYPVAAGVIRQTVSLYAVELETRNGPVVIARAAPARPVQDKFSAAYKLQACGSNSSRSWRTCSER